jgi:hypothetical protein
MSSSVSAANRMRIAELETHAKQKVFRHIQVGKEKDELYSEMQSSAEHSKPLLNFYFLSFSVAFYFAIKIQYRSINLLLNLRITERL